MKWLGHALLWIGFLGAALATVYRLDPRLPVQEPQEETAQEQSDADTSTNTDAPTDTEPAAAEPAPPSGPPPTTAERWWTIPWWHYAASMVVGIAGVVILRRARRSHHVTDDHAAAQLSELRGSLDRVAANVERARKEFPKWSPPQLVRFLDENCATDFALFADSREVLARRFGLNAFAEVMTQFASGERFVNRAWSAAADGYVEEAANNLDRASQHLAHAQQLIKEWSQATAPTRG
jgi:hypothetical protein